MAMAVPIAALQSASEIKGSVRCAGQPIVRALVILSGRTPAESRRTYSDENGLFTFSAVPSGAFRIETSKAGFVGDRAEAARLIDVPNLEAHIDAPVTLCEGGVVTGVVREQSGSPAADVPVSIVSVDDMKSAGLMTVLTDAHGVYRFYGLVSGEYWVAATPKYVGAQGIRPLSVRDVDQQLMAIQTGVNSRSSSASSGPGTYALLPSVYSAGGPTPLPVAVAQGAVRQGIDLTIGPTPIGSIAGVITNLDSDSEVTVAIRGSGPTLPERLRSGLDDSFSNMPSVLTGGSFRFRRVGHGRHSIIALAGKIGQDRMVTPVSVNWAAIDVDVYGDVAGINLALQPALRVSGRIVTEGDESRGGVGPGVRLVLQPVAVPFSALAPAFVRVLNPVAQIGADGLFDITGVVPGRYILSLSNPDGSVFRGGQIGTVTSGDRSSELPQIQVVDHDIHGVVVRVRNGR